MRKVERSVGPDLDIHVIVDNCATLLTPVIWHKHLRVRRWLQRHPRVPFHFVPTSSSWLNLVEWFFSELTTRQLKRLPEDWREQTVTSVSELEAAITRYIERRNQAPRPVVWTAAVETILARVNKTNIALATLR